MHTDLSPHLHTEECNIIIQQLHECRKEHNFTKFFGKCNSIYNLMLRCTKKERIARREANAERAKERQAITRERVRADKIDYEEVFKNYSGTQ